MTKITVYCEVDLVSKKLKDVSYELISKAHKLALEATNIKNDTSFEIEALALSDTLDKESIQKALSAGANKLTLIKENCLGIFSQTIFSQCFVEYYKKNPSEIIIFPATPKGRIVAPRITTILNAGLVADCTELSFIVKNNELYFAPTRPTFGSELMATIISKTMPQCATVRPGTFKAEFNINNSGKYSEYIPIRYEENRLRLINSFLDSANTKTDFANAKTVFIAGWGINDPNSQRYFTLLKELAKITNSKVGATRKMVDMNIAPQYMQIGQTGTSLNADLCITFGVSGAMQHLMGIKNCKTIVAINIDSEAEIFKYADYKIVADAKEIIENLCKKLKQ